MELIIGLAIILMLILVEYYFHYKITKPKAIEFNEELNMLRKLSECKYLIDNIKSVEVGDFINLLAYHQYAWNKGIQPVSLSKSDRGYFREDISNLTFETIFLGGICGLNTRTVLDWLDETNPIGENEFGINPEWTKGIIVWNQYKNILLGSLGSYKQTLIKELETIPMIYSD